MKKSFFAATVLTFTTDDTEAATHRCSWKKVF